MTNPIAQIPKPDAEQYKNDRKLFLVPTFLMSPDAPEDGQKLLERYWSEVRDHVRNLERSLEKVSHVYHEMVFDEGEEGMKMLEAINHKGSSFIQAMCHSDARLDAVEDRALLEESSDWQRCLSIGLISEKVLSTALEGYQEATTKRYERIAARIDETLKEGEAGALFIREDHRVQFPSDMRVFYVAPPGLDAVKRWIQDLVRAAAKAPKEAEESADDQPAEEQ